jgi:hypothetical protein
MTTETTSLMSLSMMLPRLSRASHTIATKRVVLLGSEPAPLLAVALMMRGRSTNPATIIAPRA